MNRARQLIRIRDDDRGRDHRLAGLGVLPPIPQAGKTQHAAVRRADEIRLPAIWPLEPFVIAACWDDAPMACERVTEHRLIGDSLGSVVEACRDLLQGLLPPPRNDAPAH